MIPPVSRLTDVDTGHGSFPPTAVISGSPTETVNSLPTARLSDALASHGSPSPSPPHGRAIASGSGTHTLDSLPVARIGDAISCGGVLATGSPNTDSG